jgi:hypothetical protein
MNWTDISSVQIVCKPTAAVMQSFVEAILAALRLGLQPVVEPKAFSLLAMQLHRLAATTRNTPVTSGAFQRGMEPLWDPFDPLTSVDPPGDGGGASVRTASAKTTGSGEGPTAVDGAVSQAGGVFESSSSKPLRFSESSMSSKGRVCEALVSDEDTQGKGLAGGGEWRALRGAEAVASQEGLASLPFNSPENEMIVGAAEVDAILGLPSPPPPVRLPPHDCSGACRASWGFGDASAKVRFHGACHE